MRTLREKKENIKELVSPDHIFNRTSIFHNPIGGKKLDEYTIDHIKKQFELWFNSWVKEDLDKLTD